MRLPRPESHCLDRKGPLVISSHFDRCQPEEFEFEERERGRGREEGMGKNEEAEKIKRARRGRRIAALSSARPSFMSFDNIGFRHNTHCIRPALSSRSGPSALPQLTAASFPPAISHRAGSLGARRVATGAISCAITQESEGRKAGRCGKSARRVRLTRPSLEAPGGEEVPALCRPSAGALTRC